MTDKILEKDRVIHMTTSITTRMASLLSRGMATVLSLWPPTALDWFQYECSWLVSCSQVDASQPQISAVFNTYIGRHDRFDQEVQDVDPDKEVVEDTY